MLLDKRLRSYSGSVCVAGLLLFCCGAHTTAQSAAMVGGPHVTHMVQEQKAMAADARQKKMVQDADRLVVLAQQLKVSVDKTNKDVLSVEVIRNAERVEKLARELREGAKQ